MAAGERARARAAKERVAALEAERRATAAERAGRRTARRERLFGWLPHQGERGAYETKRRRQAETLVLVLFVLNMFVWFVVPQWSGRVLALVASVLVAPVLYTFMFRRS